MLEVPHTKNMKPEFTRLSNTILNSGLLPGLNRLLETTKNREKKKVVTFVTTSVCERKTGLKPATPSLEG